MFAAIPDAAHGKYFQVDFINAKMRLLQAGDSVAQTLASIPPEVDALYLLPILEMSMEDHEHLLKKLALKRLPVFSLIGHPIVTILVLVVLLLNGYLAFTLLPRAEDPGFIIRTAVVTTRFPGAGPQRVEELVSDKIEKVVQELPELDAVTSTSRTGLSIINVNILEKYKNLDPIWDELRRKIDTVRKELPSGVVGPDVNTDFGDVYPVMLSITGDGYSYAELKTVADEVRDELLHIDEVAKVEIYGAQKERIFVEYNNARLAEVGLHP